MTNMPERHIITLPFGASSFDGGSPNELLFTNRHSVPLSSSGEDAYSINDWLVVRQRNDMLLPRFTTQETVLREIGVFQHGADTVMLKAPVREWGLDVTIRGTDRLDYLLSRLKLGHMLGWDLATAQIVGDLTEIPNPFDTPNPWTYTFIQSDGQIFNIDFVIARFAGSAPDADSPTSEMLETQLLFTSDNPTFYSPEVELSSTGIASVDFIGSDYPSAGPFIVGSDIEYRGSARSTVRFVFDTVVPTPTNPLFSIGLFNKTDGNFVRFAHVDYPTGGWVVPAGPAPYTVVFDSKRQQFTFEDGSGLFVSLHLEASPTTDWGMFTMMPGKTYNFFLEYGLASPPVPPPPNTTLVTNVMTYSERFSGI